RRVSRQVAKMISQLRRETRALLGQIRRAELAATRRHVAGWRHWQDASADFGKRLAVGDRYGELTVREILGRKPRSCSTCVYVYCTCECRRQWGPGWRIVRPDNLRSW